MNDPQRYKLIIWHTFLEDMNKVKHTLANHFPGYKIDYGAMVRVFDRCIKKCKRREILHPWLIRFRNENGGKTIVPFNYLLYHVDDEPEEDDDPEEVGLPDTDLPNRWYCQDCGKFVMKRSKNAHLKSKKHNRYR